MYTNTQRHTEGHSHTERDTHTHWERQTYTVIDHTHKDTDRETHIILLPGQANHTCGLWLEGFLLFPHFLPQALPPKQGAGWSRGTHLSETEAGGRVEVILISLISDLPEGLWMWWSPHLSTLLTCIDKNSMSFLINLKSFQSMRVRSLLAEVKALRVGYDC